jgi:predicted NACHT family NTPase
MVDYNWKRFWCPREGKIHWDDGGFLTNPDDELGRHFNPDVIPFASIADKPCLVLLGEPGIGKTHTVKKLWESFKNSIAGKEDQTLLEDLGQYGIGSEDNLVRDLFECPTFNSWFKGENRLYLFLDSLDECLLDIRTLGRILFNKFKMYPTDRLYLRVVCRTADWKSSIEKKLKEIWKEEAFAVYELVHLRKNDVIEAAKNKGLAPDAFLDEINVKQVGPLAAKPITLKFLLNTYVRNGRFPDNQEELYFKGCQMLCEETNDDRRDAGHIGKFSPKQKLIVASRIAAVSLFANRVAIRTNVDMGDVPDEDFTIEDICGGKETVDEKTFDIDRSIIEETIATGLFSSRGPNRMGWSHQTFAEYLAAYYLKEHKLKINWMINLITHPGDASGRIVPSLQETAAWLAGMVPEVFKQIIKSDPNVLLSSDVAKLDNKVLSDLVESLLRQYDEKILMDNFSINKEFYRKLEHPGLAEQLRVYIKDNTKNLDVRIVAIDIADICRVQSLLDDLIEITLDSRHPDLIRVKAASAISRIADDKSNPKLEKLKPLVFGEVTVDPNDELKGCALWILWPNLLTLEELFEVLTPPKANLYGVYRSFISDTLRNHNWGNDIRHALKWVMTQGDERNMGRSLCSLINDIFQQAWENLDSPGVLEDFAKAVLCRLYFNQGKINIDDEINLFDTSKPKKSWFDNDEKRRRVLKIIVTLLANYEEREAQDKRTWVVISEPRLFFSKDVLWMLECLKETTYTEEKKIWADFINRVFDRTNFEHVNEIISISQKEPILYEEFAPMLKSVRLDSSEAKKMREEYLKWQEIQNRGKKAPKGPSPSKEIARLLDNFDAGDLSAWWKINRMMTVEKNSKFYDDDLEPDLTNLPGWKDADDITQNRIIKAAQRYISDYSPSIDDWIKTNSISYDEVIAFRTLLLLLKKSTEFMVTLMDNIWGKWLPIILCFPNWHQYSEINHKIVKLLYKYLPKKFTEALSFLMENKIHNDRYIWILRNLDECWDENLATFWESEAILKDLETDAMAKLLENLLKFQSIKARKEAEHLLSIGIPPEGAERKRALYAAIKLMLYTHDAGWPAVWPVFQEDPNFGKEVIESIATEPDSTKKLNENLLSDDQLTDLYIWMETQFPHTDDPRNTASFGERPLIGALRDSILNTIKDRGTYQACEGIRKIMKKFPKLDLLEKHLFEAQNITRKQTWKPLAVKDILEITKNPNKHLVQNEQQLLDVLVESLRGLESKLRGETPASRDIWDRNPETKEFMPIDENAFSDYVKRHLDDDLNKKGIIPLREVQIHKGERTDLHVDAIAKDDTEGIFKILTVIIEVKGCWNKELNKAMREQLAGKYLSNNPCKAGIYLIGWFNCNSWDKNDSRYKKAPKISKDQAQEKFDKQAVELSKEGYNIKAVVLDTSY